MTKHLQKNKIILLALLVGVFGRITLFAQNNCPTGAINALFSVSSDKVVWFSQGNLQYQASTNTWRFAENQYDFVGGYEYTNYDGNQYTFVGNVSGGSNNNLSSTYSGWIDLFSWGTSGYNHGAYHYQPWSHRDDEDCTYFFAYGDKNYNLYDQTGQADWAYNAISNGGNLTNAWRTLKAEEWSYLMNTRVTPSGLRFAKAVVDEVKGVLVLPDNWDASYYALNNTNQTDAVYSSNTVTASDWTVLVEHGVVFLPVTGTRIEYRYESKLNIIEVVRLGVDDYHTWAGNYWSSSVCADEDCANCLYFTNTAMNVGYNYNDGWGWGTRSYGLAVRLVQDSQRSPIRTSCNPAEGGTTTGDGAYEPGTTCTVTATANVGYRFENWTENDAVVSTDAAYSFTVNGSRNLVANFVEAGNIEFDDDNVKALCVANWDTNGDGELSYTEAAAVTDLGEVFKNKTNITSFNELQYFIILSSIGEQAFYGCSSLTQVAIPEGVTSVGSKAFWNCPALQTVYFNAVNCTSMQSTGSTSVFSANTSGGASSLTRVIIGSNVTRIPDYAFKGSQDIYQRLVIPSSVNYIGKEAFSGCSGLVLMTIQGNGLQTIGESAFTNCSSLRSD